jgi:hypothetical protein
MHRRGGQPRGWIIRDGQGEGLSAADQVAIGAFTEQVKGALWEMRQNEFAQFKVGFWHFMLPVGEVRIPAILFDTEDRDRQANRRHMTPCWNKVNIS